VLPASGLTDPFCPDAPYPIPASLHRDGSAPEAGVTKPRSCRAAVQEYGEGERAHRTAYGALKHAFEKVGDHWEPKEGGRKGPSDPQSAAPRNTSDERVTGAST
jgi:hypothetical protein